MNICFVGLDGSGKSTCVEYSAEWMRANGIKHKKVRAAYVLKVLTPIVKLVKMIKIKRKDAFDGEYEEYLNKLRLCTQKGSTYKIYKKLIILEFYLQIFFNIVMNKWLGYNLIIDRYIYDNAVTMAANIGADIEEVDNIIKKMWRFAPKPDVVVYVKTPVDVCMSRKDDIPDELYLKVRKPLYDKLAERYKFKVVSGDQPKENMYKEIEEILENMFGKDDFLN